MSRYLEAFKTSLGDISQGEWSTFEGLADEDSMGAATRATMMVRHPLASHLFLPHTLFNTKFLFFPQATLHSLKSLNINATKVANYDKLKNDFDEVVGEKARLEGQLH